MPDIIIPWDGLNSGIPSGWTRYTALDGRYPKASTSNIAATGGSATHSHTGSSHTHTYSTNSHSHTTGNIDNASTGSTKTDAQHQDAPPQDVSQSNHYHDGGSASGFISSSITSDGFTAGTSANEYSRYHFIFIKGSVSLPLPSSSIVLKDNTDDRSNATHFDAADGKYMKGASTGADSGSATTVTTHNHTQSHTHTLSHTHSSITTSNTYSLLGGKDVSSSSPGAHSHTVSFTAYSHNSSNSSSVPSSTATLKYRELHFWKTLSDASSQKDDIVMTIESTVPSGWEDLGYNDEYIIGKAKGVSLTTGGSNTHTHTSLSHTHSGVLHTHAWTASSVSGSNAYRNGGSGIIVQAHTHSGSTSSATSPSTGSTAVSFSTNNSEPLYLNIKYIKKVSSGGGGFFTMFVS